jgi:glyoxylase-like metal-dependent hydrolase (beta-lactamase superfamily II)
VVEEVARLERAGEIGKIEGLWITHYHDDHTNAVNLAKRRFGMPVYAQQGLVDVLEHPRAYELPALCPDPIRVERPLRDRESFEWKGFRMTAFDFPGQTLYHDGLLVERDGYKVFFTGDCFSSRSFSDVCSQNRNFSGRHVGFEKCCRILLEAKSDIIMTAHWGPLAMPREYLEKFLVHLEAREKIYRKLFPYEDVNFGLDPRWIRAYPFRQDAAPGALVRIEACVLNHAARPKKVQVGLGLPAGWTAVAASTEQIVAGGAEGHLHLSARAPAGTSRRRHVLGISANIDGQELTEFAAAVVDLQI